MKTFSYTIILLLFISCGTNDRTIANTQSKNEFNISKAHFMMALLENYQSNDYFQSNKKRYAIIAHNTEEEFTTYRKNYNSIKNHLLQKTKIEKPDFDKIPLSIQRQEEESWEKAHEDAQEVLQMKLDTLGLIGLKKDDLMINKLHSILKENKVVMIDLSFLDLDKDHNMLKKLVNISIEKHFINIFHFIPSTFKKKNLMNFMTGLVYLEDRIGIYTNIFQMHIAKINPVWDHLSVSEFIVGADGKFDLDYPIE